jgi:aspartate carbamoyltransferase catalytic subunit
MISFPSLLLSIDDLNKTQIDSLLSLSSEIKLNKFDKFFEGPPNIRPIMATSFLENSTRTKHSFEVAIYKLGGFFLDFNAETSSLKKGETLLDTLITLKAQGVDLCIIRTSVSNQLDEFRESPPIKIINGGDGVNEHPTQALLDLFTLIELSGSKENLKGKTITIVGDLIHSRVGHSLIKLLPQFGMTLILCGPREFLPTYDLPKSIKLYTQLDQAILESDFLYMLRVQKERHEKNYEDTFTDYIKNYGVSLKRLKHLNKLIPVLHPGPCNIGVELDLEITQSEIYQAHFQVQNSVPMRMAIIHSILNNKHTHIGKNNGAFI